VTELKPKTLGKGIAECIPNDTQQNELLGPFEFLRVFRVNVFDPCFPQKLSNSYKRRTIVDGEKGVVRKRRDIENISDTSSSETTYQQATEPCCRVSTPWRETEAILRFQKIAIIRLVSRKCLPSY
jgi:hypothetical protein